MPFVARPVDGKGNPITAGVLLWELSGDPVGDLDSKSGLLTARAAGDAVVRAIVTAGGTTKSAEAKVTIRGGLLDVRGGGQLPFVFGLLALLAAVAIVLFLRRRRQVRDRRDSQGYLPSEKTDAKAPSAETSELTMPEEKPPAGSAKTP